MPPSRAVQLLAAATAVLVAALPPALAQAPGGDTAPAAPSPSPGQSPGQSPAPSSAQSPAPVPPPPSPPPAQPAPQGTPATVLDTQDYESLLGRGVRAVNGDELGRVIDVIIDKEGRPRAAIIDFGGFLGVGSRKIAVDWRALRFTTDGKAGRLSIQLSRNQVRVSPEYKTGEPIVVLGPASPAAPEPEQAAAAPPAPPAAAPAPPPAAPADKPPEKAADR